MKTCRVCQVLKPLEDFNNSSRNKDGRHSWCRDCAKIKYRSQSKEVIARSVAANKAKIVELYQWKYKYLLDSGGCSWDNCDVKNPVMLELDHIDRDTKVKSIAQLIKSKVSIETLENEAAKCRVLCANHHRLWTAEQLGWWMHTANAFVTV